MSYMTDDETPTGRALRAVREEWTKPYIDALQKIIRESPDGDAWSRAVARRALGGSDDPYVGDGS